MEGDAGYALQKLELAVIDMATGPGEIKSRLIGVYSEHLHVVNEKDFPDTLKPQWREIKKQLTKKGSISKSLFRLHKKTLVKIANNIVILSQQLRGYLEDVANNP